MQLVNHDEFVAAILGRKEVRLKFRSKEDGGSSLTRRCAPMDYGPSKRYRDKTPRYHFMDFESDTGKPHPLVLQPELITSVEILDSTFDPASFVTWNTEWTIERSTWGEFN